jgi:adenylosuccinate synthase
MIKAIVGANWGDEGKGKITDMFAEKSDVVIRFQGGANAGHTIINSYGKFALHQLPSGIFSVNTVNIIGNGVAVNIPGLMKEIGEVQARVDKALNILVSERAHVVMPYHVLFDTYEEERLKGRSFGSTKSGIAPLYSDKYYKTGIRVCDLFDNGLKEKLAGILEIKNVLLRELYHKPEIDLEALYKEVLSYKDMIAPYAANTFEFVQKAVEEDKTILLEGQLGSLKDPDFGIYPFTTSSSTLAGFGAVGVGVPPHKITDIVTVVKAYSSAVGAGPFVSEIFGNEADELRRRGGDGGEYGATTGRPRRMGWFDAVATRYGCKVQGTTEVALTVLDVLGYLDELPICVGYEIDGRVTKEFPINRDLERAKPVLVKLPGWKCETRGIKKYEDLPEKAKAYVEFIEKEIGFPVTIVSNGPKRDEVIFRK